MSVPAATDRSVHDLVTDVALYRQQFRRYLRELEWVDEWRRAAFTSAEDGLSFDATVLSRLYAAGWNRYGWPEEAGGLGGDEIHRAVYYEELGYAMLPIPAQQWTLETLGPALIRFAPALAARYLPHYLEGSEWWGQSFSEPESGSDLASLRTRAVSDGDGGFVVNGQKIWTSQGPTAKRLVTLVRTGTPESRHRGLTMLMIDADSPGVAGPDIGWPGCAWSRTARGVSRRSPPRRPSTSPCAPSSHGQANAGRFTVRCCRRNTCRSSPCTAAS